MAENTRTETPPGEAHDPFPVEDDAKLDKLYFQVRRAIRYIDAEKRAVQANQGIADAFDESRIARLKEEIEEYEGLRAQEDVIAVAQRKKAATKKDLKELYGSEKGLLETELKMRKTLELLKRQKQATKENIFSLRKNLGKNLDSSKKLFTTWHKTARAERQIEHSNRKLGLLLAENEEMRDKIEIMRSHYANYEKIKKGVNEKLAIIKYDISMQIKIANENLRLRKSITKKFEQLNDQSEKDKKVHDTEIRELKVIFKHLSNLRGFVSTKLDTRHTQLFGELKSHKIDEAAYTAHEDKTIAAYQNAIETIKRITNQSDIQVICDTFIQKEQDILTKTIQGNRLRMESDEYRTQIEAELAMRRSAVATRSKERAISEDVLKENGSLFNQSVVLLDEIKAEIATGKKKVKMVQNSIKDIISFLSVEKAKFKDRLVKPKIDYMGAIEYLSLLEDKCTAAIIQSEREKRIAEMNDEMDTIGGGRNLFKSVPATGPEPFMLKIKAPKVQQVLVTGLEDDKDVRLLTKDELYEKAAISIQARELSGEQSEDSLLYSAGKGKRTNKARPRSNSM